MIKSYKKHMHVFQRSTLLVQLRLQNRVIHQIDSSHSSHYYIVGLILCIISLVVRYSIIYRLSYNWRVNYSTYIVKNWISSSVYSSVLVQRICFIYCLCWISLTRYHKIFIFTLVYKIHRQYAVCVVYFLHITLIFTICCLII